jgi:hypothetical protein
MAADAAKLLSSLLHAQAGAPMAWLNTKTHGLSPARVLELQNLLAMIGRKFGTAALVLDAAALKAAHKVRPGWQPQGWTLSDAARALVLTGLETDPDRFGSLFQELCRSASHTELVSLYRALPLYPWSEALDWQIGEGLRTSIQPVFEAIAHHDPVPSEKFTEHRWNHMVLKALFIGSTLPQIVGLRARPNAALASTLRDYIHERWAAGRHVDPQVWQCLSPFALADIEPDLVRLSRSTDAADRRAAALFLAESNLSVDESLTSALAVELAEVRSNTIDWPHLAV